MLYNIDAIKDFPPLYESWKPEPLILDKAVFDYVLFAYHGTDGVVAAFEEMKADYVNNGGLAYNWIKKTLELLYDGEEPNTAMSKYWSQLEKELQQLQDNSLNATEFIETHRSWIDGQRSERKLDDILLELEKKAGGKFKASTLRKEYYP